MSRLCMVTYMRINEKFTDELLDIAIHLNSIVEGFKCIIFCEGDIKIDTEVGFNIEVIKMKGTKYSRILYLLENDSSEYFISIDNDITGNLSNIEAFVLDIVNNNIDAGWGKIQTKFNNNLISKMVSIDKILSHFYIRPFLWKHNKGISIPGQCFIIKRETFKGNLMCIDTFLDDLALGTYINLRRENLKVKIDKNVLGLEIPNCTFQGMLRQRSRWADGYFTVLEGVKSKEEKKLVKIHGFAYHGLWVLNIIIALLAFVMNPIIGLAYILTIACIISNLSLSLLPVAILYQFIFPIFHLRWLQCLVKKLIQKR